MSGASWKSWERLYRLDRFDLVGFHHQCGSAGLLEEGTPWQHCPGCGYEIERPIVECEPLYKRKGYEL